MKELFTITKGNFHTTEISAKSVLPITYRQYRTKIVLKMRREIFRQIV